MDNDWWSEPRVKRSRLWALYQFTVLYSRLKGHSQLVSVEIPVRDYGSVRLNTHVACAQQRVSAESLRLEGPYCGRLCCQSKYSQRGRPEPRTTEKHNRKQPQALNGSTDRFPPSQDTSPRSTSASTVRSSLLSRRPPGSYRSHQASASAGHRG